MRRFLIVPLVLLVVGCASLPVPQNTGERLVAANVAATALIQQAAGLKNAGVIEVGSGLDSTVGAVIHSIDSALTTANEAYKSGNEISAAEWLDVAIEATAGLRDILNRLQEDR